jgi:ribosomal protein S18 acetylase RimI-like enzyme
MTIAIRVLARDDIDSVVAFSLRSWRPVFESFRQVLGERLFGRVYPDWLASQAEAVAATCRDQNNHVWVAEIDGALAGFVAVVFHENPKRGEIDMLAVDPDWQRRGVGGALTSFALDQMRAAGVTLAEVGTGGDPGHAPARRTYEKAGFTALPLVRYYQDISRNLS